MASLNGMAGYLSRLAERVSAQDQIIGDSKPVIVGGTLKVRSVTLPELTALLGVNINTATDEELRTLKGVGPVLAGKIVSLRPFSSVGAANKALGVSVLNETTATVDGMFVACEDIEEAYKLRLATLNEAESVRQKIATQYARTRHQGVRAPRISVEVCNALQLNLGCTQGRWGGGRKHRR